MGKLAILIDTKGRQVSRPLEIAATVSWAAKDAIAQAYDANGKLVHELHGARVDWIEAGGIRLTGMEPLYPGATAFRLQQWQYTP